MCHRRFSAAALSAFAALWACGDPATSDPLDPTADAGQVEDAGRLTGDAGESPSDAGQPATGLTVADHAAVEAFAALSTEAIRKIAATPLYFGHTSHGSQLAVGVEHLDTAYHFANLTERSEDLGSSTWDAHTEGFLAAHPETRVVVWSWCGQQSSNSEATVALYLAKMDALERAHPGVGFIYMTGHLRGAYSEYLYEDAENATLQANNQLVRDYARAHGKWLFDFADIESHLDGSCEPCLFHEMPSECTWPETPTWSCAHSRAPNCLRKAKAFFWLLGRILGLDE